MGTTSNEGRAIVTKGTGHVAVHTAPDVCKTPSKKTIAANNWVKSDKLLKGQTVTTFIADCAVWTSVGELGPPSEPGHAGVVGGVKSGTYRFEASPTSYSSDVFFEGNPAVRVFDTTTQNHGNTTGIVLPEDLFAALMALADYDKDCLQKAAKDGTAFVN